MIEKLVLGGTGTGDLPILRRANLCAIKSRLYRWEQKWIDFDFRHL